MFRACGRLERAALAALAAVLSLPAKAGPSEPAPPAPEYALVDPVPDAGLRDMNTDRPNHVNTPTTVDAGHVQIETGLLDFARSWDAASFDAFSSGEINARIGIFPDLEVNVAIDAWETGPGGPGFGDMVVGGKLNLWGDRGSDQAWATALAVQPQVKLPTAGSRRGNGHVEAGANFPFAMVLPGGWNFGFQLTPSAVRNEHNTATVGGMQEAVSVDRVLLAHMDFYLEYWAANAPASRPQETVDTGFTAPLGKNLSVDSGVFFGLTRASVSFQYVAGVSVRF